MKLEPAAAAAVPPRHPTFAEAFRFWLKLGFISFGGPSGQIAIMHAELVEKRKWISEARFLHALNYCMLLPGPEAQQLAIYVGWLLHRTRGGIAAGALFVLPSVFILWGLSWIYVTCGDVWWMTAIFDGLKPAVLAIVIAAVQRIGKRALKNEVMAGIAALAFVALFFFNAPFPIVILTAGLLGLIGGKFWAQKFVVSTGPRTQTAEDTVIGDTTSALTQPRSAFVHAALVGGIGLTLWWLPVLALGGWLGFDHLLVKQGLFFSKAAMVTFGGAYAVLPYVSQQAVEHFGWLSAGQMLDGLGLAETTPGPLIMVLQFVGFLGGWRYSAPLTPLATATLGAFITTWTTFLPCFIWIFLGAPYIERLRGNANLSASLSTITAAVVGVILNLALWFGLRVLLPAGQPVNWFGLTLCLIALVGLIRWKWDVIPLVMGAGALGIVHRLWT